MNVEATMSVPTISVGPSISAAPTLGPSLSTGPAFSNFSPSMEMGSMSNFAPFSTIINEGPVPTSFLQNTAPLVVNRFSPQVEVISNPFKAVEPGIPFSYADVLAEVEQILSPITASPEPRTFSPGGEGEVRFQDSAEIKNEAVEIFSRKPWTFSLRKIIKTNPVVEVIAEPTNYLGIPNEPDIDYAQIINPGLTYRVAEMPQISPVPTVSAFRPNPMTMPVIQPIPAPDLIGVALPLVEEEEDSQSQVGSVVIIKPTTAVDPQIKEEQKEQEVVEESVKKRTVMEDEQEEDEEIVLQNVVDERALGTRVKEFSDAINYVAGQHDGEVEGVRVVSILPEEHEESRSRVLKITDPYKSIPDGSLLETKDEFARMKFKTREEARKGAVELIKEKVPVDKKEYGRTLKDGDYARVHKYHPHKWSPNQQVIMRMVRKYQGGILKSERVETNERKVEDNPDLAEVFKAGI